MNHLEFRQLRLRLGWSLAEMARRMGCHQSIILKWESNHLTPDPEVVRHYESLLALVDEQAERTRQMPIAESLLKDEHLSQCSEDDVVQWETLNLDEASSSNEDDSQ